MSRIFSFDRRINRMTYFAGILIGFVGMLVIIAVLAFISSFLPAGFSKVIVLVVAATAFLTYLYYTLCLTKQRANDISGDNAILYTVLAILILSIIIGVIPGENRQNRYGKVPNRGLTLR